MTASSPPALTEWPLIPRPVEAAAILRGLERSPARVQLLVGAAGVGKTVLASMIANELDHRTAVPVVGLAELAGVPLGAFGPLLAEHRIAGPPEEAIPALLALVGRDASRNLLVVDDLARLDDVSAAVVYQLVRAFGVSTIATTRLGERMPSAAQRMVDEGLTVRHDLAGLSLTQVGELLDRRFDSPVHHADLLRLTARTSGNPLYLRVLIEGAEGRGGVRRQGDVVRIEENEFPSDLLDAVAGKLAELGSEQQALLRLAALLQPVARALLAASPEEDSLIAGLEARGFLTAELGTDRLRLAHPLIAESLGSRGSATDLDEAVRRLRHAGDEGSRMLAVRLQLHSRTPPPLDELGWASRYAYGAGDLVVAAELSKALLDRDSDPATRCSALTTLAGAHSLLGDHTAAERCFDEAEELAEAPEELALVAVRRGEHLSYRRHDLHGALAQAERIRARIHESTDALDSSLSGWGASLDVIAGMPLLGQFAPAIPPELALRSAILHVVSRSTHGDLDAARTAVEELIAIQEQIGHIDPLASAAIGFAHFVQLICDAKVREAAEYLEQRRILPDDGIGIYTMLLANLRQCGGQLAEAERLAGLAVDQLRWRDGLGLLGVALGYQANAVAKQGRIADARRLLDAMTEAQRTERNAYIQVAEAEAWILAHSGDAEGAVTLIEERLGAEEGRGSVFLIALAACVPLRLGFFDRAAALLESLIDRSPTPLEIVRAIRDLAIVLRDGELEALPRILDRVEAAGQEPTVLDAIALALRSRPRAELRRKLELIAARVRARVDEPPLHRREGELLTPRELEVARAAASRERSKEIAARLGTSSRTVDTQLQRAFHKLGVSSRDELRLALRETGLLEAGV